MSGGLVAKEISWFRSQLQLRRFDKGSLEILESILNSCKDVKSLVHVRNEAKKLLRAESVCFLQQLSHRPVEDKLFLIDFFVRAFALAADVESCLALRYEALLLRERYCLQLSYQDWLTFSKDSLHNRFYSIALKGCENAIASITNTALDFNSDIYVTQAQALEEITKLKDVALTFVASHSVRAQTAEHLKNKTVEQNKINDSSPAGSQRLASSMFRKGITKRNIQKLRQLQSLPQKISKA